MVLGGPFLNFVLNTEITILWKSDIPVSIAIVFLKDLGRFVRNRSIHDGLSGFL